MSALHPTIEQVNKHPEASDKYNHISTRLIIDSLEARGFEFVAINSQLKKHPQFVCIDKNNQYFFVIVRVVKLPENPNNYDVVWMETFKKHAFEKDAKVLYAGVAVGNPNGDDLPVYLNQDYLMEYNGIQVIETNMN